MKRLTTSPSCDYNEEPCECCKMPEPTSWTISIDSQQIGTCDCKDDVGRLLEPIRTLPGTAAI